MDWETGIKQLIEQRCSSCHVEGQAGHSVSGLKLQPDDTTYRLLTDSYYGCCAASRWLSVNSARSSMLIWALYGERLDGRNPATGLPWGADGEMVPDSIPAGLRNPGNSHNSGACLNSGMAMYRLNILRPDSTSPTPRHRLRPGKTPSARS